jgi:general stress protein 26
MDAQKQQVLDFLRKHKHGVLSTVSPHGTSESAAIEFGTTDQLELIFDTYTSYRKYPNLKANSRISFVVFEEEATVQYEGIASELPDGDSTQRLKSVFFSQVPEARKFDGVPDTKFFKVAPAWIRFRDYRLSKNPLFELTFSV